MKSSMTVVFAAAGLAALSLSAWAATPAASSPIPVRWQVRGFEINVPKPDEVGRFCDVIENRFKPCGVNMILLRIGYDYRFKTHPECAGTNALSAADAAKIREACVRAGITIVPKINLLGHQGWNSVVKEGLLAAHPEFDETPEKKEVRNNYCRSLCPRHPDVFRYATDLAGEIVDAFGAKDLHIGCDEVFEIGSCPRCKGTPTAKLFADWVNAINRHFRARGVALWIWGDRLLDVNEVHTGMWESSDNGTAPAINLIDRDITVCDWHYSDRNKGPYPSVDVLERSGLKFCISPLNNPDSAAGYLGYAAAHDQGDIRGVIHTSWYACRDVMDALEGGEIEQKDDLPKHDKVKNLRGVADIFEMLFPMPRPAPSLRLGMAGFTMHKKSVDEMLAIMEKADIHYLCVKDFHLKYDATDAEIAAFRAKCAAHGVEPYAAGPLYTTKVEELRPFFAFAKRLGVKTVVGVPYDPGDEKNTWELRKGSRKQLLEIEKLVREFDIKYAIHNHGPKYGWNFPDVAYGWNLIKDLDSRVGFCLDIGWEAACGHDPLQTIRTYGARLHDIHLKNFEIAKKDGAAVPLGRGKFDYVKILAALKAVGYKGVCSIEYEKDFEDNLAPVCESAGYFRGVVDALTCPHSVSWRHKGNPGKKAVF